MTSDVLSYAPSENDQYTDGSAENGESAAPTKLSVQRKRMYEEIGSGCRAVSNHRNRDRTRDFLPEKVDHGLARMLVADGGHMILAGNRHRIAIGECRSQRFGPPGGLIFTAVHNQNRPLQL